MVRIGVSVEGTTEEIFIKKVLAPYLLERKIDAISISIDGNVSIDKIKGELKKISFNFDFITTLYDFYGFKGKATGETKETLEAKISNGVHESIRAKLIPYIQMHEFEGLLFSCPQSLSSKLTGDSLKTWAKEILSEFDNNPERINDSQESAPSKRLLKNSNYQKTIHGPNIAQEIGINKIREMCEGFDNWLKKIEILVK